MANAARVHADRARQRRSGDRTLIAFGGAAPLHAARLAEKLGMRSRRHPGQRRRRLGRRLPARADRLRGGAQPLRALWALRCRRPSTRCCARCRTRRADRGDRRAGRGDRGAARTPRCVMSARATRSPSTCRCATSRTDDRADPARAVREALCRDLRPRGARRRSRDPRLVDRHERRRSAGKASDPRDAAERSRPGRDRTGAGCSIRLLRRIPGRAGLLARRAGAGQPHRGPGHHRRGRRPRPSCPRSSPPRIDRLGHIVFASARRPRNDASQRSHRRHPTCRSCGTA